MAEPSPPRNAIGPPGDVPPADELLLRSARGDQAAFAGFYDLVAGRVYGLARKVVRDPSQAEEVAQEALVEAWRTAPLFDPGKGSAAAWVLTITHRRAVDRVRSEQASRRRQDRMAQPERMADGDPVGEAVESRLETQSLRRALEGLTELQRQAIELAYYGGLTYREVAVLLGAPEGTIKTRIRDGLVRLRDALGVTW